jgi:hypothetical protein
VTIAVYDVSGRLVHSIVRGPRGAGSHAAAWSPAVEGGAAPGVYFFRISDGRDTLTRKATVLR